MIPESLQEAHKQCLHDVLKTLSTLRASLRFGGLHLEDLPQVVKEIADWLDASLYTPHQPEVKSVTLRFGWEFPDLDDHHVFLEIISVDTEEQSNITTLSRVFCENCGGVFYIPMPPSCFSGSAGLAIPFRFSCPYCLGNSFRILEKVMTKVQAKVPAPKRKEEDANE